MGKLLGMENSERNKKNERMNGKRKKEGREREWTKLESYISHIHVVSRVYKVGEGECRTAYMLRVTAVRTFRNICNDIHVWRSP